MTIQLDGRLYNRQAVDEAVQAFAEFAEFGVEEKDGKIEVRIRPLGEDADPDLSDEFSNYVLGVISR